MHTRDVQLRRVGSQMEDLRRRYDTWKPLYLFRRYPCTGWAAPGDKRLRRHYDNRIRQFSSWRCSKNYHRGILHSFGMESPRNVVQPKSSRRLAEFVGDLIVIQQNQCK